MSAEIPAQAQPGRLKTPAGPAITGAPAAGRQRGRGPPAQSLGGINPGLPFTGIYRERLKQPAGPALGRQPPVFPCRVTLTRPLGFQGPHFASQNNGF